MQTYYGKQIYQPDDAAMIVLDCGRGESGGAIILTASNVLDLIKFQWVNESKLKITYPEAAKVSYSQDTYTRIDKYVDMSPEELREYDFSKDTDNEIEIEFDPPVVRTPVIYIKELDSDHLPQTCDAAVQRVVNALSPDAKMRLLKENEDNDSFITMYITLGTAIRNIFGLWHGNIALGRSCMGYEENTDVHVETVSAEIIKRVREIIQSEQ